MPLAHPDPERVQWRVEDVVHEHIPIRFSHGDSLTLVIRGRVGREEKLRARHTVSMISLDSYRSVDIPEDLRVKMAAFAKDG